jgi:hypothetical protein
MPRLLSNFPKATLWKKIKNSWQIWLIPCAVHCFIPQYHTVKDILGHVYLHWAIHLNILVLILFHIKNYQGSVVQMQIHKFQLHEYVRQDPGLHCYFRFWLCSFIRTIIKHFENLLCIIFSSKKWFILAERPYGITSTATMFHIQFTSIHIYIVQPGFWLSNDFTISTWSKIDICLNTVEKAWHKFCCPTCHCKCADMV